MHVLALLQPLDPVSGNRITVRVASAQMRSITGLGGQRWWAAMLRKPQLTLKLFDGDFTSSVEPGTAAFSLALDQIERMDANVRRYVWQGAPVTLQAGEQSTAWPWPTVFVGKVQDFAAEAHRLDLKADVDTSPFDAMVPVATYAGTGDIEGGADLKGKVKPWVIGRARFVEPLLINAVDSVFQISFYAPIRAVNALYERGAQFAAPVADYPNYAALVAAAIPNGRWATCLASGLIRLGAPPAGVITVDVDGDNAGGVLTRLPGAVIRRAAALAGVSTTLLDLASLNALDADVGALPAGGFINLVLSEQTKLIEIARRIARSCNRQAGVDFQGRLFVTRPAIGTPALTVDAQGRRLPAVLSANEVTVSTPYRKIQMSGARCWRKLNLDEIAFAADLTPRGLYDDGKTYREGDYVDLIDGSQWLFVGTVPAAGSYPSISNPNWSLMSGATGVPLYLDHFPNAANSFEGQILFRYDLDNRVFRRVTGDGLLRINDETVTINGETIEMSVWIEITDPRILAGLDLAGAAEAAAEAAQDAAGAAQASANAALADLALIASDNKLTPNEKPRIIQDRDVIVAEQAGIDAQASALGITTQKTAYDNAIAALTGYLTTLTTPVLWSDLGGSTDIVGATFRSRFTSVYTARQTLLDKIADALKARADAAQTDATSALTEIGRIASDGWLSRGEKPQLLRDYDALYENWQALDSKASSMGIAGAQRTAANTAMSALYSYLSGLTPGWTDTSQNTVIAPATFSARWSDAYAAIAALQAAIQGQPGAAGLSIAELTIYRAAATQPATPAGGSYDFGSKTLTPPSGWSTIWPTGSGPKWAASGYAAIQGTTGTATPSWFGVGAGISDGASGAPGQATNVIFRRSASQPATPGNSSGVPTDWYDTTGAVPGGAGTIWASFGTRATPASNWVWQTPKRVEGTDGISPLSITINPPGGVTVQGTPGGAPADGELPKGVTFSAMRGGVAKTITAAAYAQTSVNCTSTLSTSGLVFQTAGAGEGYAVVNLTADGETVPNIKIPITVIPSGADGTSSASMGYNSPQITSTSPTAYSPALVMNASSSGKIKVSGSALYKVPFDGSSWLRARAKLQISADGSSWTDIAGTETVGTTSQNLYEPDMVTNGRITIPAVTKTGLTAGGAYQIRLLLWKDTAGGPWDNSSTVNATIVGERVA